MTYYPMCSDHTARKEWRCHAGFTCVRAADPAHTWETPINIIRVGERYTDEVYPPWLLISDDPESPPTPLGEWLHLRYHRECSNPAYY